MNTLSITAKLRLPENLKANMKNHNCGFTLKVVARFLTAATLGFSVQAFAKIRTCPVVVAIDGKPAAYISGVPGSGKTPFLARRDSRSKTESALSNATTFSSWFLKFLPSGKSVLVTANTFNAEGLGCEAHRVYSLRMIRPSNS